ncbi:MAG: hypothetical protein Q4F35_05270 [Akkermansia sp.]|nr:hypothetical protein [Akkermansia sp.]
MKKHCITALLGLTLAACSSMPDGIDEDALAPYTPGSRILMCNTSRALGTSAFSSGNDCLFYEIDKKEDREAMGFYQRVSEEKAHVIIRSDDVYEVEYILTFTGETEGTVEEKFTQNGFTETYKGNFTLK